MRGRQTVEHLRPAHDEAEDGRVAFGAGEKIPEGAVSGIGGSLM